MSYRAQTRAILDLRLKGRARFREFSNITRIVNPIFHSHTITCAYLHFIIFFLQVVDGIVDRRACFSWKNDCCSRSNEIRVRNCGKFYVYNLPSPKGCYQRYCVNGKNLNLALKKIKINCIKKRKGEHCDPLRLRAPFLFQFSFFLLVSAVDGGQVVIFYRKKEGNCA